MNEQILNADQITAIKVIFSRGSFEEWTQTSGDHYPQAFVAEWSRNFEITIKSRLSEAFPSARIEAGEGYDQTSETEILIEGVDWEDEDAWIREIRYILDIGSDDEALDKVWATPSLEAIAQAIKDLTDERPVARLEYEGADYGFVALHDGAIHWLNLDVDEILDPEVEWSVGTVEEAALAFLQEIDPEFQLITQAEAVNLGAPSVQAVNNAIRDGRLRKYNNPKAEYQRQGKTLVSKQAVVRLWSEGT